MKIIILAILILTLIPTAPLRCAKSEIMLSTGALSPGSTIAIYTRITNCGSKSLMTALDVSIEPPCADPPCAGPLSLLSTDPSDGKLQPGAAIYQNTAYDVPINACTGTYTIRARVRNGQQVLSTSTATFEVQ